MLLQHQCGDGAATLHLHFVERFGSLLRDLQAGDHRFKFLYRFSGARPAPSLIRKFVAGQGYRGQ